MVFEATNSTSGVAIDNKITGVSNITGQSTESSGVVIIDQEKSIYIPNWIEDLKGILSALSSLVDGITSVGATTTEGSVLTDSPTWITNKATLKEKIAKIQEELK